MLVIPTVFYWVIKFLMSIDRTFPFFVPIITMDDSGIERTAVTKGTLKTNRLSNEYALLARVWGDNT